MQRNQVQTAKFKYELTDTEYTKIGNEMVIRRRSDSCENKDI